MQRKYETLNLLFVGNFHTNLIDQVKIYSDSPLTSVQGVTIIDRKNFRFMCINFYEINENQYTLYHLSHNNNKELLKQQILTLESANLQKLL